MCGRLRLLLTWLLAASLAHLPMPVCDGDDVGSDAGWPVQAGAVRLESPSTMNRVDIDVVLLGCDAPDDPDDGTTDDDPDSGSPLLGLGPAFLCGKTAEPAPAISVGIVPAWSARNDFVQHGSRSERIQSGQFLVRGVMPPQSTPVLLL